MTFLDWHLKGVPRTIKFFFKQKRRTADEQDDNDDPC